MATWTNIKNRIKKFFGMDIEMLMSYKDNFQGQTFQLVKGSGPRLGKVFRAVDVDMGRGGVFVVFDDGAKVPASQVSENYMMIMDDQPPMSPAEIQSINGPVVSSNADAAVAPGLQIPDELKEEVLSQPKAPVAQAAPAQAPAAPVRQAPQVTETDLFGMFALEETSLPISVRIKLPNKSLLKAMYQNSQNKAEFIDKLSAYINNSVTADSIKDSLWKMLDPDKKKQPNDKSS